MNFQELMGGRWRSPMGWERTQKIKDDAISEAKSRFKRARDVALLKAKRASTKEVKKEVKLIIKGAKNTCNKAIGGAKRKHCRNREIAFRQEELEGLYRRFCCCRPKTIVGTVVGKETVCSLTASPNGMVLAQKVILTFGNGVEVPVGLSNIDEVVVGKTYRIKGRVEYCTSSPLEQIGYGGTAIDADDPRGDVLFVETVEEIVPEYARV